MNIPAINAGAALIESVPCAVLSLVHLLPVEIHTLAAVGTKDFPVKEVDERGSDFFGFLHLFLPRHGGSRDDVLHLLEVLTGDDRFVCVREDNPLILILHIMRLDAFVDRLHRPSKNSITNIMWIGEDAKERRAVPALAGAAVS